MNQGLGVTKPGLGELAFDLRSHHLELGNYRTRLTEAGHTMQCCGRANAIADRFALNSGLAQQTTSPEQVAGGNLGPSPRLKGIDAQIQPW
jgi:hypothetical protein